ncbi:hypothetical protein B0H17DRAFT_953832 [Mycena rosella]|uniref:Paired domain-containing protein n=1 Tax=Mycena rosella TaxID=1033263 RepID=A0AAD7CRZ4_MYCRO|nr:hypothetical protein B0H17DRAFT_953832 [Mycena rosella]
MGTHKNISSEKKKLVIHLYHNRGRKQADIARDLNISLSSVEKILGRYRRDTQGLHAPPTLRVRGRPRILKTANVDFIVGLVERTPDIYLYEIQAELEELCDVEASLVSIWRALRRRGYTRKRVCGQTQFIHSLFLIPVLGFSSGRSTRRRRTYQLRHLHDNHVPGRSARFCRRGCL